MKPATARKKISSGLGALVLVAAVSCVKTNTSCIDPSRLNPDGICTMQYDPVCGCNDVTYSNACVATNAGVTSYKPGECPSP